VRVCARVRVRVRVRAPARVRVRARVRESDIAWRARAMRTCSYRSFWFWVHNPC